MKAITIHQPWAALIADGLKPIENRTWQTSYRGPLLIHAGKKFDPDGAAKAADYGLEEEDFVHGAVIAVCHLVNITRDSTSEWAIPGQYHWRLHGARPLTHPIPCRGAQQLWNAPADVSREVRGRMLAGQL